MADKEFSVTKMAAETAFANGTQEFTEHKNNNYKDDNNDSSSSKESEVAIPLSRYKTKLQECAELHHSLQSAHEELSRLKRQVNEQEVSSTETHREVEKLRVLQKMMHEELTVHQTRLRSLLSENDELAAQVHTLQEVCNYQLQTHNKKVRNNDYNNNNNDDKDAQNVDDDNNNKEIANGQSINCLTKLMERAHVNSYRYSMKEMSDKLYFATHPAFNHSTFNDDIINSSSSKCSQYIKDIVNKSDSMELEKVKSSLLLSEYVKMSCELNIEPHPQLLTCFYNISKNYTNHTNNNTKNVTEQVQSSVEFDLSLSMVEPPISFAQLSVLEQFLTRPYSCLPSSSSSSEELASIHLLTQAVQHITLRVCEESNEAGIVMFCTRILPHFTRLSELEIYHVSTTCAIKSLVETLSLLRITFTKEDNNNNSYNNIDTSNNKHAIRYLSLPFLAVNDAALQMLFTMFEQRERLCTSDNQNSTSEKDKERYETEESTNYTTANNNSAYKNSCVEQKEMLMSEWPLLAMKTLDLSLCTLTDPHTLRSWTSCPLLSCLMLTNCNMLTNSLLHHLLRHLPHLTRLDLSGCMLIDCDGLHFLNSFAHVKVLRLENVPHITQLSLQHIEVLFGTLTCVQQLKMPCVRFLPLPLRNRALISTPGYFVAPRLQQVAIHDMFIDEVTLDCFHLCETNTNNKQSIKKKCKDNSGKLNVLQFVNCTFTSDAALATLLEYYKLHNTLHTLTLRNCVGLSSQIVNSLPSSLCKVDVSFTTVITDKALQVLAERCPNLESLNLCGSASLAKDITSDSSGNDNNNNNNNNNNNEINYTALSEVGLRCLLSFSHLHTLNLLQLPSLPNDVIVMLIYALPSLKLLYHETVAISHLLNAKGELECKLRYTLNAKEKQLYDSCKNGNNNKDNENNSCYFNDIKFVNQNAQYSQLQIHRENTNNNNSEHMKSKGRNNVECFESESSSVRLMLNESEWHSKEIRICTLRDLLRCRQSVELMTWNEHQQPAFLMNPAMLTHPSIEYVNRKFAPETKNNEINANYSDNVNSDEAVTHSIHDERQKRPESAASSSSTSEMSMTLEEEEYEEEEDDRIEHSEEALEINDSSNTNIITITNTNTKANKSGKRVSFIVPEQGSKTAVQSENDKAMTRARNRAMRHNKMRQRENSDTSSSSSISSEVNNTSSKIKNYNGIKGNNNSDTVTKTDVVNSEIGPWEVQNGQHFD